MKLQFVPLLFGLLVCLSLGRPASVAAQEDDESGEGQDADLESLDEWERPPSHEAPPAPPKDKPPAPPPGDGKIVEIGLELLWGAPTSKATLFSDDAWDLGFGLRAGYTDDGRLLYPGVRAALYYAYYLGVNETHGQLYAAEIAYDWWIAEAIVVRPSVDLGAGTIIGPDINGVRSRDSRTGFYFGPGVSLMFPMDLLTLGIGVRATLLGNDLQSATSPTGTIGARF